MEEKIDAFDYNFKPTTEMIEQMNDFREGCKKMASSITAMVDRSRYQSLAMTALEECAMWMNKAITHKD